MSTEPMEQGQGLPAKRKRPFVMLMATGALAIAAVGAVLIAGSVQTSGNLDGARLAQVDTTTSAEADDSVVAPDQGGSLTPQLSTTYEVFLDRDPFSRVVPVKEVAPADGASPSDPNAPVAPLAPIDPSLPATPVVPSDGAAAACTGSQELVCGQQVVTLQELREDNGSELATIRVDDTVHEVRPGESFAAWFQLGSIDRPCIVVLYGDDAFELCSGQPVMK